MASLGRPHRFKYDWCVDIKKLTKSLMEISTPSMLREWLKTLMNKVEELTQSNQQYQIENERLKAKIRDLQGLPSKPKFASKDKTFDLDKDDDSDDDDDDKKKKMKKKRQDAARKPRRKKDDLEIDETKKVAVDSDLLDSTFDYKGERKVVVQDLIFRRNNIAFLLEKFYSSEHGKTVDFEFKANQFIIKNVTLDVHDGDTVTNELPNCSYEVTFGFNGVFVVDTDKYFPDPEYASIKGIKLISDRNILIQNKSLSQHQHCFKKVSLDMIKELVNNRVLSDGKTGNYDGSGRKLYRFINPSMKYIDIEWDYDEWGDNKYGLVFNSENYLDIGGSFTPMEKI